jgi:hypothetical protein
MDDKDKSVIDKFVDTVTNAVGEEVKSAVMPTRDTEAEALAEKTNEQMFLGDAAIAPGAAPALIAPKKTDPKKRSIAPKKSTKQVEQPAVKKPKKTALKKSAAKPPKKAAKKDAKKTKKVRKSKKKSRR